MAVHLHKGEVVTEPRMRGEAEPCGFCGRTTGTCTTSIVRKKISSTCLCVVPLKLTVAMRKQENMPRECPIPGCSGTPWVLNIKTHLARCHPTVAPNTVDLTEWVVVSLDDEKKKGRAQKIPMVMKPIPGAYCCSERRFSCFFHIGDMAFLDFHPLSPISTPFHTVFPHLHRGLPHFGVGP